VTRFGVDGVNAFAGALALGCLMLPIVIRSTEEMLKLVPNDLREASLALGSSQSRTILTIVLPAALPGIVSGVLLAVARAAGETAPLLFTIGAATSINWNPSTAQHGTSIGTDLRSNSAAVRWRPGTGVGNRR
jgi:phosphate transport system permease protein